MLSARLGQALTGNIGFAESGQTPWTEVFIYNPPAADTVVLIQALEVPDGGVVKATIRERSYCVAIATSIVALDNGDVKNWKWLSFLWLLSC